MKRLTSLIPTPIPLVADPFPAISDVLGGNVGHVAGYPSLTDNSRFAANFDGKEGLPMGLLPRWTTTASERLMDAQAIAMDLFDRDGERCPREQAVMDALVETQTYLAEVNQEITAVDADVSRLLSVMRAGRLPESRKRPAISAGND